MDREAFEKWFLELYVKRGFVSSKAELEEAWQAAKADSDGQWISVSECMPERIGAYLVYGDSVIAWAFYNSNNVWCLGIGEPFEITHWIPLPKAPETKP